MFANGQVLDLNAIKAILPQRAPMLMLDRVQVESPEHLVGVKNLSINEAFFQGHFPGHPIMPGVLQVEAIKQLAELGVRETLDPAGNGDVFLWKIDKVKFRNPNVPGDRVKISVTIESIADGAAVVTGTTENASGITCEASFTLKRRDKSAPDTMPVLFNEFDRSPAQAKDIHKVLEAMPHRYPFLLVDGVVKFDEKSAVAIKNVTANEAMLLNTGDYPVLPESVLCEVCAQVGCACVLDRPENAGKLGLFAALMKMESFAPVFAGDQLVVEVELPPPRKAFGKCTGVIKVDGKVVFSTSIMFAIVDANQA